MGRKYLMRAGGMAIKSQACARSPLKAETESSKLKQKLKQLRETPSCIHQNELHPKDFHNALFSRSIFWGQNSRQF